MQKQQLRAKKKQRYVDWYECQCKECGSKFLRTRDWLMFESTWGRKQLACPVCFPKTEDGKRRVANSHNEEARRLRVSSVNNYNENIRRRDDKPCKTNITTGIKHYSITRVFDNKMSKVYYRHIVQVTICYTSYKLFDMLSSESKVIKEPAALANELNEVLKGGKEVFYEWYENKK